MRQTLTLLGVITSITIRGGQAPNRRFEVQMLVREDYPETSSLFPVDAIAFDAQLPELAAVLEVLPGDRVEIVGHWHGFDSLRPSGAVETLQLFWVERFRVVGS